MASTIFAERSRRSDVSSKPLVTVRDLEALWNVPSKSRPEEVQRTLAALLLCAQEEERSRIARELHDDIAQQLALICFDIDRIRTSTPLENNLNGLDNLENRIKALGLRVRTLSHELHSPELDLLGLGSAMLIFCREFAKAHSIEVTCDCTGLPKHLPKDVSLCLYRVTQEALQNIAKHSGARQASVRIRVDSEGLLLRVQDSGCGFSIESVLSVPQIGLRSMRERIRLLGGSIAIHTRPGEGTTIEARVKYSPES